MEALKKQFDKTEMEFVSIEKHFELSGISVQDDRFELTFLQKAAPFYFFNVHFMNNKQFGVH